MRRQQYEALKRIILLWLGMLFTTSLLAASFPLDLEKALQQAGKNRASLEKVLNHYSKNKEKYQAACFLIENMVGHSQAGTIDYYDPKIDVLCRRADSVYFNSVKGKTIAETNSEAFKNTLNVSQAFFRDSVVQITHFKEPRITEKDLPDIQTIDGNYLIRHIDHAFDLRKKVKFAKQLSFSDFCSYLLPYRAIGDYPLVQESKQFYDVFAKYMQTDKAININDPIERYNEAASRLRWFMGKYPFETNIGFNEVFFNSFFDCVDVAHYGALALRACGIPVAVEYNVAYKIWADRHYFVSTMDSLGRWCTFSPESGLPQYRDPKFREALNIFRLHFDKQPNNPLALRATNEEIPENLSSPYIEDATSTIMDVVSLRLPINTATGNHLAYLVSFQSQTGLIPVTWGKIDAGKKVVTFTNVVPDNLYFPMYYTSDKKLKTFGDPFWIQTDSLRKEGYRITYFPNKQRKSIAVDLLRKFPRKPNMVKLADKLKGVVVIASENPGFNKADTLYRLVSAPEPYWQDMNLKNTKAYRYYRVQSSKEYPHLHIAELEFLTDKKYGYPNTIPATPLPSFQVDKTGIKDTTVVRLMDAPLDECRKKAEYDGNVQTAPDAYPAVTFGLKTPQVVTRIRFVPKNEDNGIKRGNIYTLYEWATDNWEKLFTAEAQDCVVHADALQPGKLYWLRNLTEGKEELPFVIDENGKQKFVHEDLLKILQP